MIPLLIAALLGTSAASPELHCWVMSAPGNAAALAIAPDVHAVRWDRDFVYVDSAGLSLHSFGSLEANQYEAPAGPRKLEFRIPRDPRPAARPVSTPLGIVGVFATGVPIYNAIGTVSYHDRNLWHQDVVAASASGTSPLVAALKGNASRHSPILGYALDGYPIYGPYGWDGAGNLHRMTSSYKLRDIARRLVLPDGTVLMPGQEGPDVSASYPLGTFAEDYEYAAGTGDLDEHNGRWVRTPEYPHGTYAYFMTAWPYLVGPTYYGELPAPAVVAPHLLTFQFKDSAGRPLRFLEKVHEKPVHLVVVSDDLAEFAHIHPEPAAGGVFTVEYGFGHGGTYTMFADYTPPGSGGVIDRRELTVPGPRGPVRKLTPDTGLSKVVDGVRVTLDLPPAIAAGRDLELGFRLDANNLEPYLGAWAHIMIVSADRQDFIHAHPLDGVAAMETTVHTHSAPLAGPSPSAIRTVTGFNRPGLYKLWFQFQRAGRVSTVAWVIAVAEGEAAKPAADTAADARVSVGSGGFSPARVTIPAGRASRIAFTRQDAENCASEVVFPELGIRRKLPAGESVVVELPAGPARELTFACGMNMYRGTVVVR